MDLKKRFFRRPFTTILWLILVVAMTAFLCVGAGLWYSSANLTQIIDELHTAVAIRLDSNYTYVDTEDGREWSHTDRSMYQEDLEVLESLDSVQAVRFHTLTAGYSPELTAGLGITTGSFASYESYDNCNESYSQIMVAATVEISDFSRMTDGWGAYEDVMDGRMALRVEEIICAHEDFALENMIADDPMSEVNEEGILHAYLSGYTSALKDYFQEGQRYIFFLGYDPDEGCPCGKEIYALGNAPHLNSYFADPSYVENGTLYAENINSHTNPDAPDQVVAARLQGTVEEFLADPVNSDWVEAIELWNTAQHSLPVVGTGNLDSMYTFLKEDSTIVEGRKFTDEEYDSGAKVCLLSQTLAQKNGIQVGDTIHLSQFGCAFDKYTNISLGMDIDGKNNEPQVGRITYEPEFLTQDEAFTVVGLYRGNNEWADASYSYTPNTIFIPQAAQPEGAYGGVDSDYMNPGGNYGVYLSVELKNGHMENFLGQIQDTRLAGQFFTIDQGFEKAYQSIETVADSAGRVMLMVAAGWLLLLALYVILYQGSQKRNLGIMRSLGASPRTAGNYLFGTGLALAAVGVVAGTVISGLLFGSIQPRILADTLGLVETTAYSTGTGLTPELLSDMAASSQFSIPMLLTLSLAQLAIMAAILWLQARFLAKKDPRRLLGV